MYFQVISRSFSRIVAHKEPAFHIANRLEVSAVHLANTVLSQKKDIKNGGFFTKQITDLLFSEFLKLYNIVVPELKVHLHRVISTQEMAWAQIADAYRTSRVSDHLHEKGLGAATGVLNSLVPGLWFMIRGTLLSSLRYGSRGAWLENGTVTYSRIELIRICKGKYISIISNS